MWTWPILTETAEGKLDEEPNKVSSIDVAPNRSSNALGSAGDTFQFHCLNDTTEPHISISKRPSMGLSSDIPEVNFHLTAFIPGNQHTIQKATFDPVDSGASTELSKTRSVLFFLLLCNAMFYAHSRVKAISGCKLLIFLLGLKVLVALHNLLSSKGVS